MKITIPIEFHLEVSYGSGALMWTCHQYPFTIYATPLWEQVDGISLSVQDVDCNILLDKSLEFEMNEEQRGFWSMVDNLGDIEKSVEGQRYLEFMKKELPSILEEVVHEIN